MRKPVIFTLIIALIFTFISPFIFSKYLEDVPETLEQSFLFGGPFPYAKQSVTVSDDSSSYPKVIEFTSPLDAETSIQWIPFLLNILSYFLLFFSIYSITSRFINGRATRKEKEDQP
ncbi:hypothetical protein [Cytobacillus sp. FSL K6-0265]|uniref:hypothetical protein n=1 Tax=Cytobacillus sp. FSL K6-0265 TaxID=2921448 RepID=UPI0030FA3A54